MARIPTATRRVSATGPIGIVQPTGLLAKARTAQVLGQAADTISRDVFQLGLVEAERKAVEASKAEVIGRDAAGNIITPNVLTEPSPAYPNRYERTFRKQMQNRFEMQLEIDAQDQISQIAVNNPNSLSKYKEQAQLYVDAVTQRTPEHMRGTVQGLLSKRVVEHSGPIARQEAKDENDATRATTSIWANRELHDLDRLVIGGGSDEAINKHRRAYFLALSQLDISYTEAELLGFEQAYNHHLARSKVVLDIQNGGAFTLQGFANQDKINAAVLDGTYMVDMPEIGRVPIGNILDENQRESMSTRLSKLTNHNRRMYEHGERIEFDRIQRSLTDTTAQMVQAEVKFDMKKVYLHAARNTKYPANAARLIKMADASNRAVESIMAEEDESDIARLYSENFALRLDMMTPAEREAVIGPDREAWDEQIEMVVRTDPNEATKRISAMNQRASIVGASRTVPTKAEITTRDELTNLQNKHEAIDQKAAQFGSSETRDAYARSKNEVVIPYSARAHKASMDRNGGDLVNYAATDDAGVTAARSVLNQTMREGFISENATDEMTRALSLAIDGGPVEDLITQVNHFKHISQHSQKMANRLAKQMGPNNHLAMSAFINSGENTDSKLLWEDIRSIAATGELGPVSAHLAKTARIAFQTGKGDAWKKLPDEAKAIFAGDFPLIIGSDAIPATANMQREYADLWVKSIPGFANDSEGARQHHAHVMSRLGDKYKQSTGAWDPHRQRQFSEDIDEPLNAWVHADNAPEQYYSNDTGELDYFKKRITQFYQVNYDFPLTYGVNFFVDRNRHYDNDGSPEWNYVIPSMEGPQITGSLHHNSYEFDSDLAEFRAGLDAELKAEQAEQTRIKKTLERIKERQNAFPPFSGVGEPDARR